MGSQSNRGGRQVDKDSKYYVVGSGQEGSLETANMEVGIWSAWGIYKLSWRAWEARVKC